MLTDKIITPVGSTQSKKLDILLIMAANRNIEALINQNNFREDFYQRINKLKIELPSLRERKDDIRPLADYLFNHFKENGKTNLIAIENEVYSVFENYTWPDNIRRFQIVLWDACTIAILENDKKLPLKHIPYEIKNYSNIGISNNPVNMSLEFRSAQFTLSEIEKCFEITNGNRSKTSALLNLDLDTMRSRIKIIEKNYPIY